MAVGLRVGVHDPQAPFYLQSGFAASFTAPSGSAAFDSYISDPAKPVPYRKRPIQSIGYENEYPVADRGWSTTSAKRRGGRTCCLISRQC